MNKPVWVEGLRPETPIVAAVRETGKKIIGELCGWPPSVEFAENEVQQRFTSLFEPGATKPDVAALEEAGKRLGWEFSRDFEAADYYLRNHHLEQACPVPSDRLACDFIFFYVCEAYLQLIEQTGNRVHRSHIFDGIDEFNARLRAAWKSP